MRIQIPILVAATLIAAPAAAWDVTVDAVAHHRGDTPVEVELTLDGAVTVSTAFVSPGIHVFRDIAPGTWVLTASAPGFDVASTTLVVASDRHVSLSLFPAADVALFGRVDSAAGHVEGATIRVAGDRLVAAVETVSDADGAFAFSGVPAGYYDVSLVAPSGARVERTDVDVLGPTELRFVVPDVDEQPRVREFRRPLCAAAPTPGVVPALAGLALLAIRRRR